MGKFIRTALVFMGGMTAGGYCVVNAALKSQTFTTALKDAIAKKTVEVVYGEEPRAIRRRVSYYDYNTYRHDRKAPNCCSECCQDIVFQTREDAETALSSMEDVIKQYGVVSLADVYDIAGRVTPSYAANKYGWKSLENAKVVRCREGYFIEVPKATEIK